MDKKPRKPRLNFKLELNCACTPPICPHAGPGIAKLLEAAYAKGRADGQGGRRPRGNGQKPRRGPSERESAHPVRREWGASRSPEVKT